MVPLYQNFQIRQIEALAIEAGLAEYELMQRAAQAAFQTFNTYWPRAKSAEVFCGKGNNGGDGLALASLLQENQIATVAYLATDACELSSTAQLAANQAKSQGVTICPFPPAALVTADVVVDALFGTGLKKDVQEPYYSMIQSINNSKRPIFSLDIPSGIHSDTGIVHGIAVKADVTITFIGAKTGLYTGQAPSYCGEIVLDSLNLPKPLYEKVDSYAELLQWASIRPLLPRRPRDAHKGDFGHVLVVGGDYGMGGAVRMASEAALRVGSGLVSVATRPEHLSIVNSSRPEIMCHPVVEPADIDFLLSRATVIVIGPGLGKSGWAKILMNKILDLKIPKVVDADGLNLLSETPRYSEAWVLTPHPGEAARMLGWSVKKVQQDRFHAIQTLQQKYGGVIVLKGVGTIVQGENQKPKVCGAGNPGMASGGMGDVLSGVIAGLIAQGLSLDQAAEVGVMVHAIAADKAASHGGERGLLASDLMTYLREMVN